MDDTEREMAEVPVQQYRTLIERTSDVVTVVDTDGTIQYQSPSSESIKGWSPDELVGEDILEYVHPDDRQRVSETFASLTEEDGERDTEIEFRFRSKDDGWIWLAATGSTLGPESPIDGYVTSSRDITERKEYERKIASERDFLQTVIESLPYPFYVLDVENYSIVHANDRATVDAGDTCYEVTHRRDEPCDQGDETMPCPINEVDIDDPVTVRHVHPDEDGNDRVFEVYAAPIADEDGNLVQVAESQIDITEQVEYERRLESQRDNLELLNQIVRHDIRNDIQIISSYAEALSEYVENGGSEYVERILEASRDATETTETARDITEVMLGSQEELSSISLRSVLTQEIDAVQSNYNQAVVTADGTIPDVEVRADGMLEAVFRNLLNNAIQHNDKEVPEVTVSATVETETVRVRVEDNGPGIPDERKREIFEEGAQGLDSSGTGLGLYLVETLVNRYEGDVSVEDNEPEGAVFTVTLPVLD